MRTFATGDSGPLQGERLGTSLSHHHGKKTVRAMEAIRRHPAPHQLQFEEIGRNDGTRLSAEPYRCTAFIGKHDEERKYKRHIIMMNNES